MARVNKKGKGKGGIEPPSLRKRKEQIALKTLHRKTDLERKSLKRA